MRFGEFRVGLVRVDSDWLGWAFGAQGACARTKTEMKKATTCVVAFFLIDFFLSDVFVDALLRCAGVQPATVRARSAFSTEASPVEAMSSPPVPFRICLERVTSSEVEQWTERRMPPFWMMPS